ncbi:MAG: hypothetical protein QXO32_02800 [Candidatus Bathyarchaeia archaeon]
MNVYLTQVSGDRIWEVNAPMPPQIQITVNINVLKFEVKGGKIEVSVVFAVNYNPSIAQITLKGKGEVEGDEGELNSIASDFKSKGPPPQIIQAFSNSMMAEAIMISKAIGVPPPIPPISFPYQKQKTSYLGYTA